MSREKFVRDRVTSAIEMSQQTMDIEIAVRDQEQFDEYTDALRGRKGNKTVSVGIDTKIPEGYKT